MITSFRHNISVQNKHNHGATELLFSGLLDGENSTEINCYDQENLQMLTYDTVDAK